MSIDALVARLRVDAAKPVTDRSRYDAAWELRDEDPDASIPGFRPLLDDPAPGVRELAAWLVAAFASAGDGSDDPDDDGDSGEPRARPIELAVPRVCALAATDPVVGVRSSAMRAVQFFAAWPRLRDQVGPVLEAALADPGAEVRVAAAFGLLRTGTSLPLAAAELGAALARPEPPNSNEHQEICMQLAGIGRQAAAAVPGLLARLMEAPDADLTVSIIDALGAAGTPEAIAQLRDLDDPDTATGRAAQRALRTTAGS